MAYDFPVSVGYLERSCRLGLIPGSGLWEFVRGENITGRGSAARSSSFILRRNVSS